MTHIAMIRLGNYLQAKGQICATGVRTAAGGPKLAGHASDTPDVIALTLSTTSTAIKRACSNCDSPKERGRRWWILRLN